MVLPQQGQQRVEVLREVVREVLAARIVVQAVADEDVVKSRQLRRKFLVTARVHEALNVFAAEGEVDDVARRQVALGGEELADDVLEVRAFLHELARDAALGRAVAEDEDLHLALVLGAQRSRPEEGQRKKGGQSEDAGQRGHAPSLADQHGASTVDCPRPPALPSRRSGV